MEDTYDSKECKCKKYKKCNHYNFNSDYDNGFYTNEFLKTKTAIFCCFFML